MRHIVLLLLFYGLVITSSLAQTDAIQSINITDKIIGLDALAYTPDGSRIAVGGRDNIIRLYDALSGDLLMDTDGHTDWVTDLAFTPDGKQLISASRDDSVRLFDAQSGALLRVLGQHDTDILSVAVSPDGNLAISGSRDGLLNVWHIASGEHIQQITFSRHAVWDLVFLTQLNVLAVARGDGRLDFWQFDGQRFGQVAGFVAHEDAVVSLEQSTDGKQLITGSVDRSVSIWNLSQFPQLSETAELTILTDSALTEVRFINENPIFSTIDGTVQSYDIDADSIKTIIKNDAPITALTVSEMATQTAFVDTQGTLTRWQSDTVPSELLDFAPTTPIAENPPPTNNPMLSAPTINLSVEMTTFLLGGGTWQIDPWEQLVGHFQGTSWINTNSNVVLGGHSEMPDGTDGIFASLYNIGIGDEITVQEGNLFRRYVVVNIKSVDYRDLSVLYPTNTGRLTLITCDIPSYVVEQGLYYERFVIVADEMPSS